MDISFMVELDRIFGVDISFEAERSLGEDVAMFENCLENFLFSKSFCPLRKQYSNKYNLINEEIFVLRFSYAEKSTF